jgi:Ca2+-binding RTX toxin-like protein
LEREAIMGAVHGIAVVTASVVALTLAQAAPGRAAVEATVMCFGEPATIVGTSGPDFLVGGADDVVAGLGGDDWLFGGTVCAGAGNDVVGGPDLWTNDKLDGGNGDDQLQGDFGVDLLLGGAGNDVIADTDDQDNEDSSDPGTDVMKGGPGNDRLVSEAGRNLVYGNEGDDQIQDYTHMRTVVSGGPGNDTIDATRDNRSVTPYQPDSVSGDGGRDSATVNRIDKVSSTESVTYVD